MGFRISTPGLYHTAERRLMENLQKLYDAEETVLTGKKLRRPGDNPPAFTRCVHYKSMERTLNQFKSNIASSQGYLAEAESALQSAANLVSRAKELALQGASGTLGADSLAASASEVRQLRDQMLSLANASWSGGMGGGVRYIFSGFKTDQPAFDADGLYQGDEGIFRVEISPGESMPVGLVGSEVFQGDVDIFGVMQALGDALENGDAEAVQSTLDGLDRALSQITASVSELGARANQLDQTESRLGDMLASMQGFISQEEDVDLIQAATQLTWYQQALTASVSATKTILQTLTML
jgi:flagellar hook-associated protein 3 FlgL